MSPAVPKDGSKQKGAASTSPISCKLASGLGYTVMAVTVGAAATMLGPNTDALQATVYECLIQAFAVLFGSTHAKPLSELNGRPPFGFIVAFLFVASACVLTVLQIIAHLTNYVRPSRQRLVIRILLMVPIYAVDSFWSYLSFRDATWVSVMRDTYEAYVLYNFYALLMDFLGGEDGCVRLWATKKDQPKVLQHSFPLNHVLPPMVLSKNLLWWWKQLLVQYMLLSPLITAATFIAGMEGVFDEDSYSLANAHVYLMLLKTVSVTLAFTALFYLYLATKHVIHDFHPTGKFISIKFVIFFSFWQYLAITTAHSYGLLPDRVLRAVLSWSHGASSLEDQEIALCNILLCVEMFVTAILHDMAFDVPSLTRGATPDDASNQKPLPFVSAVRHAFSVSDVLSVAVDSTKEAREAARKKTQ